MQYVPVGTGIAAAVVLAGVPVVTGGYAGEIGQVLVTDPATGERVRMESVASAAAIARRDAERRGTDDDGGGARAVVERARAGDERARQVLAEAVAVLADVLATTVGALGPVRTVIGGGLAGAGELLLGALREELAARLLVAPVPEVVGATLGPWSQALGAAALAMDAAGRP